jgi:hypothetical protein
VTYYMDWENEENYSHIVPRHKALWAWEFIRRNPDYQAYWEESVVKYNTAKKTYLDSKSITSEKMGLSALTILTGIFSDWIDDIYIDDSCISESEDGANSFIRRKGAEEKWGIYNVYNPRNDQPFELGFMGLTFLRTEPPMGISPHERLATINLKEPITPQIEAIERMARRAQKSQKIKPKKIQLYPEVWLKYLRVLDCEAEAKTRQERAAKIIFPEQHNNAHAQFRSALKEAKKLVNGGYKKWL